jgi:hypothetical protein
MGIPWYCVIYIIIIKNRMLYNKTFSQYNIYIYIYKQS